MDDGLPRALAAGRGPRGSVLAVSSGLLSAASPAELEAVLAHELAHVRHRDVVVQTSVVVLAATLLELSGSAAGSRARCCSSRSARRCLRSPDALAEARVPRRRGRGGNL